MTSCMRVISSTAEARTGLAFPDRPQSKKSVRNLQKNFPICAPQGSVPETLDLVNSGGRARVMDWWMWSQMSSQMWSQGLSRSVFSAPRTSDLKCYTHLTPQNWHSSRVKRHRHRRHPQKHRRFQVLRSPTHPCPPKASCKHLNTINSNPKASCKIQI